MIKKILYLAVVLIMTGCKSKNTSSELSNQVERRWGSQLSDLSINSIEICQSPYVGGYGKLRIKKKCNPFVGNGYDFYIDDGYKYWLIGTSIKKTNGKWTVEVNNILTRKMDFESASLVIHRAVETYIANTKEVLDAKKEWD